MAESQLDQLPDDPQVLREMILAQRAEHDRLVAEQHKRDEQVRAQGAELQSLLQVERELSNELRAELDRMRSHLAYLLRKQFGRSSEKLTTEIEQLQLILEEAEMMGAAGGIDITPRPTPEKQQPVRRALPDHLPREEVVHTPACQCETCGGELKAIGEDVAEILDYVPASFKVIRHVRPKFSCTKCQTIVQSPAPGRPIARGLAGPGLLAQVAVSKFADHQPLYRQSQIYARQGVELERSTLADWLGQSAALLEPLQRAIRDYVMSAEKIHADDTPVPVLQPGRKHTKLARLWGYIRDDRPAGSQEAPAVWFAYSPDRKGKWPREHLKSFTGQLQADGYAGYNPLYETGQVHEVACWAHVRRKFVDIAEKDKLPVALEAIERIAGLYGVEKLARGQPPDRREAIRQARAGPLLDELKQWLHAELGKTLKKSALANAIRYALTRWGALTRYVNDGRLEIDNNAVEREIRPIALGRKNWLFAGSDSGGERAAAFYSLLNTAKLNGIDPYRYLSHVMARIADHPINRIDELLPWRVVDQLTEHETATEEKELSTV